MNNTLASINFCVFDLETTGFDPEAGDEPIEVAAVRIIDGEIADTFQTFVSPRGSIPKKIQSLTGISPEDVSGAPSPERALGEFQGFAGDDVLVAHNIDFDRSFLEAYAPRKVENEEIDTLRMARKLLADQEHSLDYLVETYDVERSDSHRALEDARATAELFLLMCDRVSTYEDYRRCGIPESVMKQDLEVLLPVLDLDSNLKKRLVEEFDSLNEILSLSSQQLRDRCELEGNQQASSLMDNLRLAKSGSLDLEPTPSLTNCYKTRYWNWANWLLNGIGAVLVVSGLFMRERSRVLTFLMVSVPFFLWSPGITYFRESRYSVLKQICLGLGIFVAWSMVLVATGTMGMILSELNLTGILS